MYGKYIEGLVLLCCLTGTAVHAQKTFCFSTGAGIAYVSKKELNADYTPVLTANITATLMIPVSEKIFAEAGIGYRRKGFNSFSQVTNDDQNDQYHGRARYDYIGIPLTIAGTIKQTRNGRLWIGGGMVYGFMLRGRTDIHHNSYIDGVLRGSYDYSFRPRIGLVQSRRKEIELFAFDTGLKLQAVYIYRKRWLLQLFHEHSLYSFVANAHDGSSLKQRYTGISIGIVVH